MFEKCYKKAKFVNYLFGNFNFTRVMRIITLLLRISDFYLARIQFFSYKYFQNRYDDKKAKWQNNRFLPVALDKVIATN